MAISKYMIGRDPRASCYGLTPENECFPHPFRRDCPVCMLTIGPMPSSKDKILARTRQLVAQACDEGTTVEERRTFAVKACQLIEEWDLLDSRAPEVTPTGVAGIADAFRRPEIKEAMREATSTAFDLFTQSMISSALRGAKGIKAKRTRR